MFEKDRRSVLGILPQQVAVVSGLFIYAASNSFLSASIGPAGRSIGLTEIQAGLILSLGALAIVPFAPFWGYMSERRGRRFLILMSLPCVLLSPLAMALVFSGKLALTATSAFWVLASARTIKGVFGSALISSTQACIADLTEKHARISGMGLLSASIGFGVLAGSALLWLIADQGIVLGFVTLLGAGGLIFFLSVWLVPDTRTKTVANVPNDFHFSGVRRYFVITFSGFAAYSMILPILGLKLIDDLQMANADALMSTGAILTVSALALALVQTAIASRRGWRARKLLLWGSCGALVGLFGMIASNSVVSMALFMGVVGASLGTAAPGNLGALSLATGQTAQGKVAGFNTAFRGAGITVGPLLGTALYQSGSDVPFLGAGALVFVILWLSWRAPLHH